MKVYVILSGMCGGYSGRLDLDVHAVFTDETAFKAYLQTREFHDWSHTNRYKLLEMPLNPTGIPETAEQYEQRQKAAWNRKPATRSAQSASSSADNGNATEPWADVTDPMDWGDF